MVLAMSDSPEEKQRISRQVVERTVTLVLSGFGLVAALAWNDAIQGLFLSVFGAQGSLPAKFLYAIFVTIIITIVSIRLSRWEPKK
jgi:hypothetical protein